MTYVIINTYKSPITLVLLNGVFLELQPGEVYRFSSDCHCTVHSYGSELWFITPDDPKDDPKVNWSKEGF